MGRTFFVSLIERSGARAQGEREDCFGTSVDPRGGKAEGKRESSCQFHAERGGAVVVSRLVSGVLNHLRRRSGKDQTRIGAWACVPVCFVA